MKTFRFECVLCGNEGVLLFRGKSFEPLKIHTTADNDRKMARMEDVACDITRETQNREKN